MSQVKLTTEELAALDFLIEAVRAQKPGIDTLDSARAFTAAIVRVTKKATKYTPAVLNVATAFIGLSAKRDAAAVSALEELKSTLELVSLDQLIELRRQAVIEE